MSRFTKYDVFISLVSTASYITDVATDIALVVYFLTNGHLVWGVLTASFLAIANILMLVCSFQWHVAERKLDCKRLIVHILFLAPLFRYFRALKLGLRSRKSGKGEEVDAAYKELHDVSILRLVETFLEAAPMLVLQLYIVLIDFDNYSTLLGFSMFFSLFSVAWAVAAYTDAFHLAYQKLYKHHFLAMATHFLCQSGMVTSRVVSIALFATVFKAYMFPALAVHFIMMVVWITKLRPEFGTSTCQRCLYTIVAAVIHLFCFVNLKQGRSRYRMAFYYIVMLIETAVFMFVWWWFMAYTRPVWFEAMAFSVVFGSFLFGILCMLLYYGCCHASGPAPILDKKPQLFQPSHGHNHLVNMVRLQEDKPYQPPHPHDQMSKPNKPSLFDVTYTFNLGLNASLDLSKDGLIRKHYDNLDQTNQRPLSSNDNSCYGNPRGRQMEQYVSPQGTTNKPLLGESLSPGCQVVLGLEKEDLTLSNLSLTRNPFQCNLDSSGSLTEDYSRQGSQICEQQDSLTEKSPVRQRNKSLTFLSNRGSGEVSRVLSSSDVSLHLPDSSRSSNTSHNQSAVGSCRQGATQYEHHNSSAEKFSSSQEGLSFHSANQSSMSQKPESEKHSMSRERSAGTSRLSLSYSDLNSSEDRNNKRRYSNVLFGSVPSVYNSNTGVNKSLTFLCDRRSMEESHADFSSDTSVHLPDNSYSSNVSSERAASVRSYTKDSALGQRDRWPEGRNKQRSSPVSQGGERTSVYSQSSRESSSYLSDRGLSISSRGLSSSSHTNNTSSGFQSEWSDLSETSPFSTNVCGKHQQQVQLTPLAENEINSMPAAAVTSTANRTYDLETDVDDSNLSGKMDLPTYQSESDFKASLSELPPIRVSRLSSASGLYGYGRFFKDPSLDDEVFKEPEKSDDECCSAVMEQSTLSNLLSDMSSIKRSGAQSTEDSMSESSGKTSVEEDFESDRKMATSLPYVENELREQTFKVTENNENLTHQRQLSDDSENTLPWQWSESIDSESVSSNRTSRNYFELAGTNVLSFLSDYNSSKFSENSDSVLSVDMKRQPLKALENTPVFSPICGQERRLSLELSSRKRFTSTPKLSTGSDLSVASKNSEDKNMSVARTPKRRRSNGVGNQSGLNDTSVWCTETEV